MNDNKQVRSFARQMRHYFWQIPYTGFKDAKFKQAANTPAWVENICKLCYIDTHESPTTNRFIVEALDIIITKQSLLDRIERHVKADLYVKTQLQWLAESEQHLDYLNYYARGNTREDTTQILKKGQLIRKQEIARIILKSLRETKKKDVTPGKKLRPRPIRLTSEESTTE